MTTKNTTKKLIEKPWQRFDAVTTELFSDKQDHYLLLEGDLDSEIEEKVLEINPKAKMDWVYEDTDLDSQKEHGPLLVRLELFNEPNENDLALLEIFKTQWIQSHLGIIISTPPAYSSREIKEHLQALRYVDLADTPAEQKVLFRWYEPRGLLGLFKGFNDKQTQQVLGNIQQLIWCEWVYDQGNWYHYKAVTKAEEQVTANKLSHSQLQFDAETIKILDDYDFDYYVRCLTRELMIEGKKPKKISEEKMLNAVKKHCHDAHEKGFTHEDDVKHYISIHLQYAHQIQQNKKIQTHLADQSISTWKRLNMLEQQLKIAGQST